MKDFINKLARKCNDNVTLRCLISIIFAVEKQNELHILSVCDFRLKYHDTVMNADGTYKVHY